jgi:hypothetical protein
MAVRARHERRPASDRVAPRRAAAGLVTRTVDQLSIEDERAFRHVPIYAALKEALRRDGYAFRVLPRAFARWNHALLLNLAYWGGDGGQGGDVVESVRVPADVVAHAAWHHLAARAVRGSLRATSSAPPSSEALFFGESIASAFDGYLVGRLLSASPRCAFLATQVPAMAAVARDAGLSAKRFATLLETMARDPEGSFESLRELLYDTSLALVAAPDAGKAHAILVGAAAHPFGALLHRYELSNWVLYARAYAGAEARAHGREVTRVRTFDEALRRAGSPLAWLSSALFGPGEHGV